ncbi:heme-binding protein [Mycobacterium sp. 1423905.2]|uniref:SOUL family heme-binding protein n=1 Tax=Mycobacterium sp. 1423905.2 TaxID=1856859 RepID=UPI0007FFE1E6|nr:heme-binding protein [Mycobacterium sp. 1423905.2]OBJ52388.1 heme-binding protein [Mycobacterium sp. 1423905.2]
MLDAIGRTLGQVAGATASIFGIRSGTQEPPHSSQWLHGGIEIRQYGARIVAQTTVDADEEKARNIGFRRLANYIFGGNNIAMTAPVAQEFRSNTGEKIAMTAPVAQRGTDDGEWLIQFFMPAEKTMTSLPQPNDPAVTLVQVPPETYAVRRFSGSRSPDAIARQSALLRQALCDNGITPTATPVTWFYDPPWTIPMLRRSEVAVPIDVDA